ncbi:hypothetical protein PTI98_004171 [Pleurotus ostreatus]|nr:hypothetical protein PTI98_004171 [Pleurotus ostreatus]
MMGPGGRQDTLDDFCNFWNWRKTVNLGNSLLGKMTLAIAQAVIHHQAFSAFTSGLREHHLDELCQWEGQVRAWESDQSNPCPFDIPRNELCMSDVKKAMAEEEHRAVERGGTVLGDASPSAFLISGLDIEESQQELLAISAKTDLTTVEATQLQTSRTSLLKRVKKFRDIQTTYMPGLQDYLKSIPNVSATATPESILLYLPSFFSVDQRASICPSELSHLENRLRFAQATEALTKLRRQLRTRSFAHSYKTRNVHSQGAYTRSRLLQNQIEVRIKAIRVQYMMAREALLSLQGPGDWESSLRPLLPEDIRGINERTLTAEEQEEYKRTRMLAGMSPESVQSELNGQGLVSGSENVPTMAFNRSLALGEGRRTLSWIWYTVSDEELSDPGEVQACLRVEWVKARARAERWREEVLLLEEEMRRAIAYCCWKAEHWENVSHIKLSDDASVQEGGEHTHTVRPTMNDAELHNGRASVPPLVVELDLEDEGSEEENEDL